MSVLVDNRFFSAFQPLLAALVVSLRPEIVYHFVFRLVDGTVVRRRLIYYISSIKSDSNPDQSVQLYPLRLYCVMVWRHVAFTSDYSTITRARDVVVFPLCETETIFSGTFLRATPLESQTASVPAVVVYQSMKHGYFAARTIFVESPRGLLPVRPVRPKRKRTIRRDCVPARARTDDRQTTAAVIRNDQM